MINLAIEGNIGAGKSTVLEYLSKKFPSRINIFAEPVDKWRNLNNVNLLDLMYKDPKKYGFIFQSYVQLTMIQMHDDISRTQINQAEKKNLEQSKKDLDDKQSLNTQVTKDTTVILKNLTNNQQINEIRDKKRKINSSDKHFTHFEKNAIKVDETDGRAVKNQVPRNFNLKKQVCKSKESYSINMMERSIFSSRYIFVENLYQNNLLSEIEYKILDETFLFLIKKQNVNLDLIIYLRSSPEECYRRMLKRSRPEETQTLQLEHFEKLHQLHEDFLMGESSRIKEVFSVPVLVIDTMNTKQKMFEKIDFHSKIIMNDLIKKNKN